MPHTSQRAVSFGSAARDYDRFRMAPPSEALDWLLPADCESVLDLGAGTGLLSGQLTGRVSELTAVEPDARMREVYADNYPTAALLEGTAENIPLPGSRVDAVLVSAAWHWMNPERALPEIARVLKPGGTFGVLWTRRDRQVPWVAELEHFVRTMIGAGDEVAHRIQRMSEELWLLREGPFAGAESHVISWETTMTSDEVAGMFATYSAFIAQPEERKQEIADEIRRQVRGAAGDMRETVRVPLACHCWRMRQVAN